MLYILASAAIVAGKEISVPKQKPNPYDNYEFSVECEEFPRNMQFEKIDVPGTKSAEDFVYAIKPKRVTYSPDVAARICARIADGESLRSICRDDDMPSAVAVFSWIQTHSEFKDQYLIARDLQSMAAYEDMLQIERDVVQDNVSAAAGNCVLKSIQWRLERMDPSKYNLAQNVKLSGDADGDPINISANGEMRMSVDAITQAIEKERLKEIEHEQNEGDE